MPGLLQEWRIENCRLAKRNRGGRSGFCPVNNNDQLHNPVGYFCLSFKSVDLKAGEVLISKPEDEPHG